MEEPPLNFTQLAGMGCTPRNLLGESSKRCYHKQRVMHKCVSNCFCLGFAMHSYGEAFAWKHLLAFMHTAQCLA